MEKPVETDLKNFIRLEVLMIQACATLRRIFRERWKILTGTEWQDCPASGHEFIANLGSEVYSKVGQLQRRSLEKGDVHNWDLPTLSKILLNVDFSTCENTGENNNGTAEKKNLQELLKFRNVLAHNPTKTIGSEEFRTMWKEVAKILVFFGYSKDKLEELRTDDNIGGIELGTTKYVNPKNDQEAMRLKGEGNKAFKDGNLDKAFQRYTEAIEISEVSDQVLAVLYSNKAAVYIKKYGTGSLPKNEANVLIENAIENAQKAINLNPTWWKSYYKLGQAYEVTDKLQEALHAFQRAVVLNPLNENVRAAKDSCLHTLAKYGRGDHLNPRSLSLSLEEQLQATNEATGSNITFHNMKEFIKLSGCAGSPLADVYQADRLRDGLDGEQSYEKAAKLYKKAARNGNAEGIYNLALLTLEGKGVKKDIKKAISLFKQAAAEPLTKNGMCNLGVAESEFAIGLLYSEGVGFDLNPSAARLWYERASEHGNGVAANNLGCMYMGGVGTEQNTKRAIQYWRLAAERGSVLAMESLCGYYLEEENPEQAKMWYQRALENGSVRAKLDREKIHDSLRVLEERAKSSDVVMWEKDNGLQAGDLSLRERVVRMRSDKYPAVKNIFERLKKEKEGKSMYLPTNCDSSVDVLSRFDPEKLTVLANEGSKTAAKVLKARNHFNMARFQLMAVDRPNKSLAIHHLAECLRTEHTTLQLQIEISEMLLKFIEKQLRRCPVNETSLLDCDMHVCYAFLRANAVRETISFLYRGIGKYPEEKCFYVLRANLFGFLEDYEEGLRKSKEALALFPNDVDLLGAKADFLKFIKNIDPKETIAAYEHFLQVAATDHRKVPEAYYMISYQYFLLHRTEAENSSSRNPSENKMKCGENFELMEKYYNLGVKAELLQLPCFLPYDSTVRENLALLIEARDLSLTMQRTKLDDAAGTAGNKVAPAEHMPQKDMTTLTDPHRLLVITSHRQMMASLRDVNRRIIGGVAIQIPIPFELKLKRQGPFNLTGLKPITLRDMDPTKDHVYEGFVLQVTSIEDADLDLHSINLVIEDENYDVQRSYVYNFPRQDVHEKIGFGCKFGVMNPYMRMTMDGKPAIRVDDPASFFFHSGRVIKKCRFCGKDDATHKCSCCKRAFYCSKDCQIQDWKLLKHKLICR